MSRQSVDGWIADKGGISIGFSKSKVHCAERMTGMYYAESEWHDYQGFEVAREKEISRMLSDGWRIRPVKLVFLDEEKAT